MAHKKRKKRKNTRNKDYEGYLVFSELRDFFSEKGYNLTRNALQIADLPDGLVLKPGAIKLTSWRRLKKNQFIYHGEKVFDYMSKAGALAKLMKKETRKYTCRHYDECLIKAAKENSPSIGCHGCGLYAQAERQVLSKHEMAGIIDLWSSVFGEEISLR